MIDPEGNIDMKIFARFNQGGASKDPVYAALSAAILAIQAVPTNVNAPPSAIPSCTTFFEHYTALATTPLESVAAQYADLKPLNNFWKYACDAASLAIAAAAKGEEVSVAAASAAALQQISDVSARVAWDGDNAFGFDIGVGGLVDQSAADDGWEMLYDALQQSLPWIDLQYLPLARTAMMDLSASYDFDSGTTTFSAFTGNYLWLLSLVRDPVKATFGVDLPEDDGSTTAPTTAVSMSVSSKGLQQLSVGLGGSWKASEISKRLGVSWAANDDLLTISAPSVVYSPIPVALAVTMQVDIPALGVSQMTSSLNLVSGGSMQLQLFGQFQPIPGVTVTSMVLTAVNGNFQASASGVLANTPMTISGQISRSDSGTQQPNTVALAMTASNINLASILKQIFEKDGLLPAFLLDFVKGITFSTVSITYNSAAPGKTKFGIIAVPELNGATALKAVLDAVGLDPSDLALRMGPSSLAFGISKTYSLKLPAPFTGPGVATWSLAIDPATKGAVLGSSFSSAIAVSGVQSPVGIDIAASVSTSAANGLAIAFAGATTSPIVIKAFSFIKFAPFKMSASVSASTPPILNQLTLAGGISVLGVSGTALFAFHKNTGTLALQAQVSGIDLQSMVSAATGVNMYLGPLNMQLDSAKFSYSTVNIAELNIPMGLFFSARLTWRSMQADVAFALSSDGVDFAVKFDMTEFSRVFNQEVLGRLDAALNAAGAAMKSAGSALMKSKAEAEAKLQAAQKDVDKAKAKVEYDLQVFNKAKKQADADLKNAKQKVESAAAAFEAAKKKAYDDLEKAKRDYENADRAFNEARDNAYRDLDNARRDVDNAQRDFDNTIASAQQKINDAQGSVNWLKGEYDWHANRCDAWPHNWGHCVSAGANWIAYEVANGVLNAARGFLNDVVNGAVRWTLDRARDTLNAAQQVADGVLTGVQWTTRQAAMGILDACQKVAEGVLKGSEVAALESAKAILTAANAAADGILTGTHFVALQTSLAGLDLAKGTLKAAEAAASSTLSALNNALNAVGGALQSVKTANFLQLTSCSLAVRASKTKGVALGFGYGLTVLGTRYTGKLVLSVQDPLTAILNALKSEILKPLKAAFPAIAPYV
eukprot:gene2339-2647_t